MRVKITELTEEEFKENEKMLKVIDNYLKFFPKDNSALTNENFYKIMNMLKLNFKNIRDFKKSKYLIRFNDNIFIFKSKDSYTITHIDLSKFPLVVGVYFNHGRLGYVTEKYYYDIEDEWKWFTDKLLAYNPVDYDLANDYFVYDTENGRKILLDFEKIEEELKIKIQAKILKVKLERKKAEIEKLKKEIEESEDNN